VLLDRFLFELDVLEEFSEVLVIRLWDFNGSVDKELSDTRDAQVPFLV
jgi:hypothetical protein